MKDAARDELELKLFGALMNDDGVLPGKVLEVINEALKYVQTNPSILAVDNVSDELEIEVIRLGEVYEKDGATDADAEGYKDARYRLDAYRETVLIMEELA